MYKMISSMKLSVVLFLLFACASGLATFIESKYGTPTAWALIYASPWFAAIQVLLGINLFFALFRYKMYEKLPLFIFHISFLFMLLGSALTRYYGFEGYIHIRENETSNIVSSREAFFSIAATKDGKYYSNDEFKYISVLGNNDIDINLDLDGKIANLKLEKVILHAKPNYKEELGGMPFVLLNVSGEQGSSALALEEGRFVVLGQTVISNKKNISMNARLLEFNENKIKANFDLDIFDVKTKKSIKLLAENEFSLEDGMVISFDNYKIGFDKFYKHGVKYYEDSKEKEYPNAYLVKVTYDNESKYAYLFEGEGQKITLANQTFSISYTAKLLELPFSFTLNKFELERYMASNSPKSYASYIRINDEDNSKDYKIYMNNVLDHKGYRFYQSSYDKDELGTILSVNQDPGKIPTYIGYFLLGLGLFFNLISKNSRFMILTKRLAKISSLAILFAICVPNLRSDELDEAINNANKNLQAISLEQHVQDLSILPIQKDNGRIAPFGSLALDLVNKIHKSSTYLGKDATEVLIWIMSDFKDFSKEKFIYLSNQEIRDFLNLGKGKYASFYDFFPNNVYALKDEVEKALRMNPNKRGTYEKELLKVDERLNILYYASLGGYVRASFEDGKALNVLESSKPDLKAYFLSLINAYKDKNYALSSKILNEIKADQGTNVDNAKFKLEVVFDKVGVFTKLSPVYLISGLILLILVFVRMISGKTSLKLAFKIVYYLNILVFIVHTIALAIRGYLSGHAPWSNSYESLLYIAWALGLSGIVFSKKSPISLSLTSILAAIVLMVAHLSSIDPQIGNLAPVLQSYWLTIHVSVITASYGFFGLCSLLGIFVLILFAMLGKNKKLNERIKANIKEATMINEMAMILGLSLLTLGNFLGGVWANESWGRYWGWDSKETWALVSILVYAAVLHIRLIKGINNQFYFAVCSMFAYLSIVMTYFGVNYFLSGMHSYAAGEAASVPVYAYVCVGVMILLTIIASKNKKESELL